MSTLPPPPGPSPHVMILAARIVQYIKEKYRARIDSVSWTDRDCRHFVRSEALIMLRDSGEPVPDEDLEPAVDDATEMLFAVLDLSDGEDAKVLDLDAFRERRRARNFR